MSALVTFHEVYLIVDAQGNDAGFFRARELTAWQAAKEYAGNVSSKVKSDADDPKRRDSKYVFIHACFAREGGYKDAPDIKKSQYESVHFEEQSKHVCKSSGYFEFPLTISRWDRDGLSPYGSPPQAKLMGDIKSLQQLAKDALIASSQAVRPPLATHSLERQINQNPGKVNPGLINEAGQPLFRSMVDTVNPGAADSQIDRIQEKLRIALYGDLWQTLLDGNGRTAFETNVRRKEMAEQIGPFATNIMAGNENLFEREFGILGRRGAFHPESPLAPPDSVGDRDVTLTATAPIDQMREAGNFEAIMGYEQWIATKAQTDPSILDEVDGSEEHELVRQSLGLPAKLKRSDDEIEQIRAERAEKVEQQEQLAMGESMARMAKDGAPMLREMNNQGGGNVG